jgi:hypothetical protein
MGIAGHQANPFQTPGHKAAKELEPKSPIFGGAHVQPDVGVLLAQAPAPEPLNLGVEFLAQTRDLALADPGHPKRLNQFVNPSCRNTLDVSFLDDAHQHPFRPTTRLEQTGEEGTVPNPRNLKFHGSHPRVPLASAIPVAMSRTFRRPFVLLCPQMLGNLKVHQRLSQNPDPIPKKIGIPGHLCLAKQIRHCHPEVVGHRCGSPFV